MTRKGLSTKITVGGQKLKIVIQYKYFGLINSEEDFRMERISRVTQQPQN